MKITDEELLKSIWYRQVSMLPVRVIHTFTGCRIAVCDGDGDWCYYSSYISQTSRHLVTDKIGPQQLLKRIRCLVDVGLIKQDSYSFWIDTNKSHEAFMFARQLWLDRGVPTGSEPCEMPSGRLSQRSKTIVLENWKEIADKLKSKMIEKFCLNNFHCVKSNTSDKE